MIDLGRQLENRLRAWREELPNHLYHPVADLAFEGFVTRQRLPLQRGGQASPRALCPRRHLGRKMGIRLVFYHAAGLFGPAGAVFGRWAASSWSTSTASPWVRWTGSIPT